MLSTLLPFVLAASTLAQGPFPSSQIESNQGPRAVVVGDFNADTRPDLLALNTDVASVTLFLAQPGGGFAASTTVSGGSVDPNSAAVADLNGDGKLDAVVAHGLASVVGVLIGNGAGAFAPVVTYPAGGTGSRSIHLADFNNDGKLDAIVANRQAGTVSILPGDGAGHFGLPTPFPAGPQPQALAVGDLNSDGFPDLAVANPSPIVAPGTVVFLFANGTGGVASTSSAPFAIGPTDVGLADLNGDAKLDVVVSHTSSMVSVRLGNGLGGFGSLQNTPVAGGLSSLALRDLDADGRIDVLVAVESESAVGFLKGNGAGAFSRLKLFPAGSETRFATAADLDADGRFEAIAASKSSSQISILHGTDPLPFGNAGVIPTGVGPTYLAFPDLNADGKPDLAIADYDDSRVEIRLGDGTGAFSPGTDYPSASNPYACVFGDLTSDGALDLVTPNFVSGTIEVRKGDGAGAFGPTATTVLGLAPIHAAVGDLNGDGKTDVVVARYQPGAPPTMPTVSLLQGDGAGGFAAPVSLTGGGSVTSVALADFNGDGKLDLTASDFGSGPFPNGRAVVWLGTGTGGFAAPTSLTAGTGSNFVLARDLNGDGRPDLVVANSAGLNLAVMLATGPGTFAAPVTFPTPTGPETVDAADFDGDGILDLASANYGILSSNAAIYRGNGIGGFGLPITVAAGFRPYHVVAEDLDADGKPDLGVANYYGANVSILGNTAPLPAGQTSFGTGTPGCDGTQVLGTNSIAKVNAASFAFTCTHTPANSIGIGIVGDVADLLGTDVLGVGLLFHVNVSASLFHDRYRMSSGLDGLAVGAYPIPNDPTLMGKTFVTQSFWASGLCGSSIGLSSSTGLSFTIQ